jgi:ABC-type taurine transport system substrate-binding protein
MSQLHIVVDLKWGLATDDVDDISLLPPDFAKARELWATGDIDGAGRLLEPYLSCLFISSNMDEDISDIINVDDDEQSATNISITGVDFSNYNIPVIRASAHFRFEALQDMSLEDFKTWQKDNEYLDHGISFAWAIEVDDDDLSFEITTYKELAVSLATPDINPTP